MDTPDTRLGRAHRRLTTAHTILDRLGLFDRWQPLGSPVLVGSVALDLVVEPDIDIEVYSSAPSVVEGFAVLASCAQLSGVRKVRFTNALDLADQGLYWRLDYELTPDETWKIDMWWLPDDHPGPRAADLVAPVRAALDDSARDAVLAIKEDAAARGEAAQGVRVYQAVLDHGIRTYEEFRAWRARNPADGLVSWQPSVTRTPR